MCHNTLHTLSLYHRAYMFAEAIAKCLIDPPNPDYDIHRLMKNVYIQRCCYYIYMPFFSLMLQLTLNYYYYYEYYIMYKYFILFDQSINHPNIIFFEFYRVLSYQQLYYCYIFAIVLYHPHHRQ